MTYAVLGDNGVIYETFTGLGRILETDEPDFLEVELDFDHTPDTWVAILARLELLGFQLDTDAQSERNGRLLFDALRSGVSA